jgi:hypothetical protein
LPKGGLHLANESKKEPIEGFHFTDYDEETETLTISIDPQALKNPASREAMGAVEIIVGGPSVSRVTFVPRER